MDEETASLVSQKPLKPEFDNLHIININNDEFTIGRSLENSVVIAFITISRNHCTIKKVDDTWIIEDSSSYGIQVNDNKLKKGSTCTLKHNDILQLDPTGEFIYKFITTNDENDFDIPRKRIKRSDSNDDIIRNVRIKFEESQTYELKNIEEKIHNAKQMQTTSMLLKQQLELRMSRQIAQLQEGFASQIENLKGEKTEVERQKLLLEEERDAQLEKIKQEKEDQIAELLGQIKKHNETENELLKENSLLKEKLTKERDEFLAELDRENTSKQELLDKLETRIREQEEISLKQKQELEESLKKETEQLRQAKDKELQELQELKKQRELELEQQVINMKKNLEEKIQRKEEEKLKAEQEMQDKVEEMKKLNQEDKNRMEQLLQERAEAENKLSEAQKSAEQSLEELKKQVADRETQLAALAAERIQMQAEQSTEVINTLQEQLEKVKSQLESVESEKNTILENICLTNEGSSKEAALNEVGNLMESELQCSICAEIFIQPTMLNCSHTYCKYCITMWKKKKKECPICRATITSECKNIVLDSFMEKILQNLNEDMKQKREALLKDREELEAELTRGNASSSSNRRGVSHYASSPNGDDVYDSDLSELVEEEEFEEEYYHRLFRARGYDNNGFPYGRSRGLGYYRNGFPVDTSDEDDEDDSDYGYDEDEDDPDTTPADTTPATTESGSTAGDATSALHAAGNHETEPVLRAARQATEPTAQTGVTLNITDNRMALFKRSIVELFRSDRANSLPMYRIRSFINRKYSHDPFSTNEMKAAIHRMTEANEVMEANGTLFLI